MRSVVAAGMLLLPFAALVEAKPSPWKLVLEANGVSPYILEYRYQGTGTSRWIQFRNGVSSYACSSFTYSVAIDGQDSVVVDRSVSLRAKSMSARYDLPANAGTAKVMHVVIFWVDQKEGACEKR